MTLLKAIETDLRRLQADQEIHFLGVVLQRRLDLIAKGKVERAGERHLSRYRIAGL